MERPATEVSRDGDNSRDPQGLVHDARTAWLFTGDTRVWEVSKKGWWRTVGGWGVVLVLLLPFGGLFAAISALSILKQFDSNLVDQTSPPGHCITNIIGTNITTWVEGLQAKGLTEKAAIASSVLPGCTVYCDETSGLTMNRYFLDCANAQPRLARKEFLDWQIPVFLALCVVTYTLVFVNITCRWRNTATSALTNKRASLLVSFAVRDRPQYKAAMADRPKQGLCRRLRNLPTVAKLYLLVAWQTVRRESPVPPKSLVQKAKAMNKLKNLFIGFGGLLWVWKMGAMEALEIWTQSMNLFRPQPAYVEQNKFLAATLTADCILSPTLAACGYINGAVAVDIVLGLMYLTRGVTAFQALAFNEETSTVLDAEADEWALFVGGLGFMIPVIMLPMVAKNVFQNITAGKLQGDRPDLLPRPGELVDFLHSSAEQQTHDRETGRKGSGTLVHVKESKHTMPTSQNGASGETVAVPVLRAAQGSKQDTETESSEAELSSDGVGSCAKERRRCWGTYKRNACRLKCKALMIHALALYGLFIMLGTSIRPWCEEWETCEYCEPLMDMEVDVFGSWSGTLSFAKRNMQVTYAAEYTVEAPVNVTFTRSSDSSVVSASMTLGQPLRKDNETGPAYAVAGPSCGASYSVTCKPMGSRQRDWSRSDRIMMALQGPADLCNIPTPTNMWFRQARLVGWKSMHLGDLQREEAPDPTTPPSEMAQSPMSDGFGYVFEIVPLGPNTLSLRYPDDRIAMNHYTDGKEGSLALQSPGDLDLWMRLDRA